MSDPRSRHPRLQQQPPQFIRCNTESRHVGLKIHTEDERPHGDEFCGSNDL